MPVALISPSTRGSMSPPPVARDSDRFRQVLALRQVEQREALQERDCLRLFAGVRGALARVFRNEAVGVDHRGAMLAFPNIGTEAQGLTKRQPALAGMVERGSRSISGRETGSASGALAHWKSASVRRAPLAIRQPARPCRSPPVKRWRSGRPRSSRKRSESSIRCRRG